MKSLYLRAAQNFLQTLPEVADAFRQMVMADRHNAASQMHTLKGTSALLGATGLSASALELEQLCKSAAESAAILRMADQLDQQIALTTRALTTVTQALAQELAGGAAPPQPVNGQALDLRRQLLELDALLIASDLAALEKFSVIRNSLKVPADGPVRSLEEALNNLELDEAHRICLAMLAKLPDSQNLPG